MLLLVPLAVSAVAWGVPGSSEALRGFAVRAPLTGGALITLMTWYLLVVVTFVVGARAGRAIKPWHYISAVEDDPRFERRVIGILTVISAIGVVYALYLARSSGLSITTLSSGQGNQLSAAISSSAGLTTLRYTPVVSAPLAVANLIYRRNGGFLAIVNIILLLAESLFTSRLSLIIATVVFLFLIAKRSPAIRLKWRWIILAAAVFYLALAALNFFRNSLYYRANGVSSPLVMNLFQIGTYLGAPFQASIGVAGAMFSGQYWGIAGQVSPIHVLVPSFFTNASLLAGGTGIRYGGVVDVASNLTTNSAFVDTYWHFGLGGLLLSLVLMFGGAMFFGHAFQYRTSMVAIAGVIGYTLSDYWRILMLNQGIVVYLVIIVVIASAFAAITIPQRQLDLTSGNSLKSPRTAAVKTAAR